MIFKDSHEANHLSATAHAFCASRDGPRKSGFLTVMPAKTEIFWRGL